MARPPLREVTEVRENAGCVEPCEIAVVHLSRESGCGSEEKTSLRNQSGVTQSRQLDSIRSGSWGSSVQWLPRRAHIEGSFITELKAHRPSRTCDEGEEEEEPPIASPKKAACHLKKRAACQILKRRKKVHLHAADGPEDQVLEGDAGAARGGVRCRGREAFGEVFQQLRPLGAQGLPGGHRFEVWDQSSGVRIGVWKSRGCGPELPRGSQ